MINNFNSPKFLRESSRTRGTAVASLVTPFQPKNKYSMLADNLIVYMNKVIMFLLLIRTF